MIEYQAHWPLQPICMMTIAYLLMMVTHMIQDMHRSENLAYPLYSPLSHKHCAAENPKVVTVTVTDIFST